MLIWQSFLLSVHIAAVATDRFDDASVALLDLLNQVEHPALKEFRQPLENIIKATLEEEKVDIVDEVILLHKNISPTLQFLAALNDALLLILEPTSLPSMSSLPTPTLHPRVRRDGANEEDLPNHDIPVQNTTHVTTIKTSSSRMYPSKFDQHTVDTIKSTSAHKPTIPSSIKVNSRQALGNVRTPAVVMPTTMPNQRENYASMSVLTSTTIGNGPIHDSSSTISLNPSPTATDSSGGETSASPWSNDIVTSSTTSTSSPVTISTNPPILKLTVDEQNTKENSKNEDSTSNYSTSKNSTNNHIDNSASADTTDTNNGFPYTTNYDYTHDSNDDFATDDFSNDEFVPVENSTNEEMPSNQISDNVESNNFMNGFEDENMDGLVTGIPVAPTDGPINELINELPTVDPTAGLETVDDEGYIDTDDILVTEGSNSINENENNDESLEYTGNSTYGFLTASLLLVVVVALLYVGFHNRKDIHRWLLLRKGSWYLPNSCTRGNNGTSNRKFKYKKLPTNVQESLPMHLQCTTI